ncbi:hypothetical protein BVY00_00880 [bacterium G20]|nr:hypothetical protein BVY00_00880 [bacterium G20]
MARILFIEADRILGSNARAVLKRAGHGVDWHVDPQAAMDSADAVRPDIVILDLMLAGRSGVEFLYEFRSYPEWSDVPVIVYSNVPADEFNATYVGFNELDIAAYYYKPTSSIAELANSIEHLLKPATT